MSVSAGPQQFTTPTPALATSPGERRWKASGSAHRRPSLASQRVGRPQAESPPGTQPCLEGPWGHPCSPSWSLGCVRGASWNLLRPLGWVTPNMLCPHKLTWASGLIPPPLRSLTRSHKPGGGSPRWTDYGTTCKLCRTLWDLGGPHRHSCEGLSSSTHGTGEAGQLSSPPGTWEEWEIRDWRTVRTLDREALAEASF